MNAATAVASSIMKINTKNTENYKHTTYTYTVRHKNNQFFHHNLNKSDQILISFGTNIPDTTDWYKRLFSFPPHPSSASALSEKENEQNIASLTTSIIA